MAKDKGNGAYKAGKLDRAAWLYTRVTELVGTDQELERDKDGAETRSQVGGKGFGGSFAGVY